MELLLCTVCKAQAIYSELSRVEVMGKDMKTFDATLLCYACGIRHKLGTSTKARLKVEAAMRLGSLVGIDDAADGCEFGGRAEKRAVSRRAAEAGAWG